LDRLEAVWLLDEDPDLGRRVGDQTRTDLRTRAVVPLVKLARGPSDLATLVPIDEDDLGALVLEGLLARNVLLAGRSFTELLGPEDLLRPHDDETEQKSLHGRVTWIVMEPTRLAILDQEFARRTAPWLPAMTPVLLERTVRRARWLTLRLAILETKRIEDRLLLLLWHLADRWGRVQPDGVHLPLRLTHDVLGQMVAAHRSSVTTALNRLVHKGALARGLDGIWILRGPVDAQFEPRGMAAQVEPTSRSDRFRRRLRATRR
jgi:CRP/FNR family transcriptional regulator, cyclic AMP receptor protein